MTMLISSAPSSTLVRLFDKDVFFFSPTMKHLPYKDVAVLVILVASSSNAVSPLGFTMPFGWYSTCLENPESISEEE